MGKFITILILILGIFFLGKCAVKSCSSDNDNQGETEQEQNEQAALDTLSEDTYEISNEKNSSTNSASGSTTIRQDQNEKSNPNDISQRTETNSTTASTDQSYPNASVINESINSLSKTIPLTHIQLSDSSSNDTSVTLNFNTLRKDACHWGDLDAISMDLGSSELLLSVENITPDDNSFYPVVQFVSPASLERGSFYFTLPRVSKPVLLGLFLCKDSNNGRHCNNKSVQSISQLLNVYKSGKPVTNPKFTKDKIYFFQSFILTPTDMYILDTVELNKHTNTLKEHLQTITGLSKEELTPMVKRLKSVNKNILSENVTTTKNTINLLLPKYSEAACNE